MQTCKQNLDIALNGVEYASESSDKMYKARAFQLNELDSCTCMSFIMKRNKEAKRLDIPAKGLASDCKHLIQIRRVTCDWRQKSEDDYRWDMKCPKCGGEVAEYPKTKELKPEGAGKDEIDDLKAMLADLKPAAEKETCQLCGNEEDAPIADDLALGFATYGKIIDGKCEPCRLGAEIAAQDELEAELKSSTTVEDELGRQCEVDECSNPAIECGCGNAHCADHPHVELSQEFLEAADQDAAEVAALNDVIAAAEAALDGRHTFCKWCATTWPTWDDLQAHINEHHPLAGSGGPGDPALEMITPAVIRKVLHDFLAAPLADSLIIRMQETQGLLADEDERDHADTMPGQPAHDDSFAAKVEEADADAGVQTPEAAARRLAKKVRR